MEPADFSPPPRDTPEQDPPPARTEDQSRERVSAYDLMVVDDSFEGLDQKKEEMRTIFYQIQEKASLALELSLKWEEIDEQFKQRAIEAELKEASLREQTLELEKKEERLKLVQERERKIEASLIALEEKENESHMELFVEANVMRLVLQLQNEEVVVAQQNAQEKLLGLLQDSMLKKHEEVMGELEMSKKEASLLSKSVDGKSCDLEMKVREFDLKQAAETEKRRKETERMETSLKQLEERENELNETIREKSTELEKKEEDFLLKVREIELKSKFLELKEKELEEREKEVELKQMKLEERAIQAETRKRSRLESESSSWVEKGSDADQSLIRPGKMHKPNSTQQSHYDEDKEKDLGFVVSDSTSSPVWISEAHGGEIDEAVSIDDSDEDHEPLMCVNSEFNDFSKTISSFMVDQVWALYDPIDKMPRYYAQIKRIFERQLRLRVKWLEAVETTENEEPIPACGRFKYGESEIQSQLVFSFSHEMYYTIDGENVIINPRKGEIWALFRDWTKTWNIHREQHKTPYRYDFVEVLSEFDSDQGIGVAYLGKVEGFTSVYKLAEQNGFVKLMIASDEMLRFSHRVPSFKLTGNEKEGVPAGSFELDPAAVPLNCLKAAKVKEELCP